MPIVSVQHDCAGRAMICNAMKLAALGRCAVLVQKWTLQYVLCVLCNTAKLTTFHLPYRCRAFPIPDCSFSAIGERRMRYDHAPLDRCHVVIVKPSFFKFSRSASQRSLARLELTSSRGDSRHLPKTRRREASATKAGTAVQRLTEP